MYVNTNILTLHNYQYLEALSWQGARDCPPELAPWRPTRVHRRGDEGDGEEEVDMDQVVVVLKALEPLCSQQVRRRKGADRGRQVYSL